MSEENLAMYREIASMMMDINNILNKIEDIIKKGKDNIPYNFNILDEQCGHIVENSHTNILMKILQYKVKYKDQINYAFLESFFDYLNIPIQINLGAIVSFEREKFFSGQQKNDRIDGLIYQKDNFALIIENKINGAVNGDEQLLNYIKDVLENNIIFNENIDEENRLNKIWVIFLTKEGGKPDSKSINYMKEKGILDNNEEEELEGPQYAAVNYRDHILPWLKNNIQPFVMQREQILNTGLLQYIDFLEGMFGMRQQDIDLMAKCKDTFVNIDEIVEIRNLKFEERNNKLLEIYNNLSNIHKTNKITEDDEEQKSRYHAVIILENLIEQINEESMSSFIDITRRYFESSKLMKECVIHPVFNFNYIQIRDASWPRSIHFEWCSFRKALINRSKKYTLCFHVECKEETRNLFATIGDKFIESKFDRKKVKETSRTLSYIKQVNSEKPILDMNDEECKSFLEKVYGDIKPELIECINEQVKQLK